MGEGQGTFKGLQFLTFQVHLNPAHMLTLEVPIQADDLDLQPSLLGDPGTAATIAREVQPTILHPYG